MVPGGMLMGDHSTSIVPMIMVMLSCRVVLLSGTHGQVCCMLMVSCRVSCRVPHVFPGAPMCFRGMAMLAQACVDICRTPVALSGFSMRTRCTLMIARALVIACCMTKLFPGVRMCCRGMGTLAQASVALCGLMVLVRRSFMVSCRRVYMGSFGKLPRMCLLEPLPLLLVPGTRLFHLRSVLFLVPGTRLFHLHSVLFLELLFLLPRGFASALAQNHHGRSFR